MRNRKEKPSEGHRNWSPVKTVSKKDAELFDTRPEKEWLNPNAMSALQKAVLKRDKQVFLNGTKYSLDYGHIFKHKYSEDTECVRIKRADGKFGSFGYVSMKRITDFTYET